MRVAYLACLLVACKGAPPAPPASHVTPAAGAPAARGKICDTPDHIYVVDAHATGPAVQTVRDSSTPIGGTVVAISRPDGKRVDAPINPGSANVDSCSGTAGGHAGCSEMGGDSIESSALDGALLQMGTYRRYSLSRPDGWFASCRDSEKDPWIAACSTLSWFATLGRSGDAVAIHVYRKGGQIDPNNEETPEIEEPVQGSADHYEGKQASITFDATGGYVEIGGKREPCLALYREPPQQP